MIRLTYAVFLLLIGILVVFSCASDRAYADPGGSPPPPAPVSAQQPNSDIYTCCNLGPIDYLNAGEQSFIKTAEFHWTYTVEPGCGGLDAGFRSILQEAMSVIVDTIGRDDQGVQHVFFVEDPKGYPLNFNCGVAWNTLAPGAVGCLCRSWPWNDAIDFDGPTMLNYAFRVSQLAVVWHELMHALGTWNEQYNITAFSCISGWHDFMNCGPDSRHAFEVTELERYKRTMYPPALTRLGADFNGQHYVWACGFDPYHATRLSILIDRHDGRGPQWSGIIRPLSDADKNGCIGTGEVEGLAYNPGWTYLLKQESPISWFKWFNEAAVP